MIKVFTDGGSRGNPGPAATGIVIYKDGELLYEDGDYLGISTNNVAECTALLNAVTWLVGNNHTSDVNFYLDSELIVKQMSKTYKIKNENLKKIFLKINKLIEENFSNVTFTHVPRVHNKKADNIVNNVLNENK